jgi:membrane protein implicated in regulation of membrane protease activity
VVELYVILAVILLGIEAFTLAFFAVFVAVGLLAAAVAAAAGLPVWGQLATLSAVAVAGLVVARPPLARAMMRSNVRMRIPGVQDLVGQTALTVDEVGDEHHPGHALLAGEHWLAIAENGLPLPPQSTVTVAGVRGTTLVVRPAPGAFHGLIRPADPGEIS